MRVRSYKTVWIAVFIAVLGLSAYGQDSSETYILNPANDGSELPAVPISEIKAAPATPIAEQKAALGDDETWQPEWDVIVEAALPPEMLSPKVAHAVKPFCPRFNAMSTADKRAYWAYFFQALAGAEAGLKPTSNVQHTQPQVAVIDRVTHRTVRSQGLLQLTYEDSKRYKCDFDWDADKYLAEHDPGKTILQPRNNLLCGVKILSNQLLNLHRPLLSSKSYWSTLRPGTASYKVFKKQMANVPEACVARPSEDEPESEGSILRGASNSFLSSGSSIAITPLILDRGGL